MSSSLAVVTGTAPVQAGVWNMAGQTQLSASYDDNVRLTTAAQIAAWNSAADLSGQVLFQDDGFLWRLSPRVLAVRYDGERMLNRTEQYLSMLTQKNTERSNSSMLLSGTQDTTLTSELGLTGLAEVNKKHRSWAATVSNGWNTTERIKTNTQLYVSANHYLDAERTGLVDYNYGSAVVGASYDATERSRLSLQASMGKLQAPDLAAYDKTNLAATLGYGVQLAPRWRADLSLGPSLVRTSDRTDRGSVYDVSLTRKSELMNLNLAVSRDVTPTGRGLFTRREQVRLGLTQVFSERWSTAWSVTAIRNRNLLPEGGLEQSAVSYGDLTGNVRWSITPTWSLSLSAGYTQQKVGGDATSNQPTAERRHAALNVSWNGLMQRLN